MRAHDDEGSGVVGLALGCALLLLGLALACGLALWWRAG